DIPDAELRARLAAWTPVVERPAGGYARLYHDHVEQAHAGADLDFLRGCRGNAVARESH
ncbi:MAG: dihydroxy-acid dehydratase, partial [Proteobacteria bacterium]|nr:dihydroxy-acid dehydratase [Pseudomonadota bacterium]